MEEIKINGKAIYATKGAAREYGRAGCNFYTGCPHECEYCYLKRGAPSRQLGGNVVQLKKCFKDEADAIEKFKKDVEQYKDVLKKTGVFFSFTTDPMIEETIGLTIKSVCVCAASGIPVKVLTKEAWVDMDMAKNPIIVNALYRMEGVDLVHFGFTLTGRDDMEPKASTNLARIEAMTVLHVLGFRTWASIEPVVDWQHASMVIDMSIAHCDHYKIGLRSGVKKDYYDLVQSGWWLDDLTKRITDAGRTVYLKESARELLRRCYEEQYCNEILSRTVDMDGNQWQPINE